MDYSIDLGCEEQKYLNIFEIYIFFFTELYPYRGVINLTKDSAKKTIHSGFIRQGTFVHVLY